MPIEPRSLKEREERHFYKKNLAYFVTAERTVTHHKHVGLAARVTN